MISHWTWDEVEHRGNIHQNMVWGEIIKMTGCCGNQSQSVDSRVNSIADDRIWIVLSIKTNLILET